MTEEPVRTRTFATRWFHLETKGPRTDIVCHKCGATITAISPAQAGNVADILREIERHALAHILPTTEGAG